MYIYIYIYICIFIFMYTWFGIQESNLIVLWGLVFVEGFALQC